MYSVTCFSGEFASISYMSGDRESKYWAELFRALAFVFATPAGLFFKELCTGEIVGVDPLIIAYRALTALVCLLVSFWFIRWGGAVLKWEDKIGDIMRKVDE
jgi:hypothetical protein